MQDLALSSLPIIGFGIRVFESQQLLKIHTEGGQVVRGYLRSASVCRAS